MNYTKELYEINILDIVYQLLISDEKLLSMIDKYSIFQLLIPEENREKPPVIRITGYQSPAVYADGKQLAWSGLVQIDVWDLADAFKIATRINQLMKTIHFKQSSPVFEMDEDTYLIRDGRRYTGTIMSDLDSIANE